jgi:Uma2 family endonuclease
MTTALRFTVGEYDRMIEQGIFDDRPEQRLELIYGEIRDMPPPNPPHAYMINLLNYWSVDHAPREQVHVQIQNPLGISALDSVPLPDVAWMKSRNYRRKRPEPRDVLLLVEVSESSLAYDRGEKAALYAAAGLKDYWVVNLPDACIEVHRRPRSGEYRNIESFGAGQTVSPLAFPEISLDVDSLFAD